MFLGVLVRMLLFYEAFGDHDGLRLVVLVVLLAVVGVDDLLAELEDEGVLLGHYIL
jgi:hypothetical protein